MEASVSSFQPASIPWCAPAYILPLLPFSYHHLSQSWCLAKLPSICIISLPDPLFHPPITSTLPSTNNIVLESFLPQFCVGAIHPVCGRLIQALGCIENAAQFIMCACRWRSVLVFWFGPFFTWQSTMAPGKVIISGRLPDLMFPCFSIFLLLSLYVCIIHTMELFIAISHMLLTTEQ